MRRSAGVTTTAGSAAAGSSPATSRDELEHPSVRTTTSAALLRTTAGDPNSVDHRWPTSRRTRAPYTDAAPRRRRSRHGSGENVAGDVVETKLRRTPAKRSGSL